MIDTSETRTVMRPGRSEASETPGADWAPIQAEHRALATSVERLDRTLAGVAAGTLASWTEVQMLLRNFRRLLWLHLDSEERSGILERAADAEPRFERRISRLRSEHDELRREVDALATGPDAASAGADWSGFHARFVSFRAVLELHEQEESDILHRTYLEDIGGRG